MNPKPSTVTPSSLTDAFNTYFEVVPANSHELIETVYRIRHKVYCEELGFEKKKANRLEFDEFDLRSIHCLLRHKPSHTYAGCVRLVLPDAYTSDNKLPFEHICKNTLNIDLDSDNHNRLKCGEISRLAVMADFRRRPGERSLPEGKVNPPPTSQHNERRQFPSVALGLYLAITASGLKQGLEGVFAMMEPKLARQLRIFGFEFNQVGNTIQHRGTRAPFYIDRTTLFQTLKPELKSLLESMTPSITQN